MTERMRGEKEEKKEIKHFAIKSSQYFYVFEHFRKKYKMENIDMGCFR